MEKEHDIAVIYDSTYGHTKTIAKQIAEELKENSEVKLASVRDFDPETVSHYNLLVFGCPTQHHKMTDEMNKFLERIPVNTGASRMAAVFDTRYEKARWRSGSAAKKLAKKLEKMNYEVIHTHESFYVEDKKGPLKADEYTHASTWAKELQAKLPSVTA